MADYDPTRWTSDRAGYLARVAASLRLPDSDARDVIEELEGHIADSTAALMADGLSQEQASGTPSPASAHPTSLPGISGALARPRVA